jgi:hypothetical protein
VRASVLPVLLIAAVPALASPAAAPTRRTAASLHESIQREFERLDALVAKARVPVSLDVIRLYRSLTPEQLADARGRTPTAEDILDIAKDDAELANVREEAAAALVSGDALRNDRKLDLTGKAMARPRAKFTKKVLPMLTDKDPFTRELGKRICEGLWPGFQDKDVQACRAADLDSCSAARRAWTKYIER